MPNSQITEWLEDADAHIWSAKTTGEFVRDSAAMARSDIECVLECPEATQEEKDYARQLMHDVIDLEAEEEYIGSDAGFYNDHSARGEMLHNIISYEDLKY